MIVIIIIITIISINVIIAIIVNHYHLCLLYTTYIIQLGIDPNIHIFNNNNYNSSSNIDPVINIETVEIENSNSNNEYVLFDTAHGENSNFTEGIKEYDKTFMYILCIIDVLINVNCCLVYIIIYNMYSVYDKMLY